MLPMLANLTLIAPISKMKYYHKMFSWHLIYKYKGCWYRSPCKPVCLWSWSDKGTSSTLPACPPQHSWGPLRPLLCFDDWCVLEIVFEQVMSERFVWLQQKRDCISIWVKTMESCLEFTLVLLIHKQHSIVCSSSACLQEKNEYNTAILWCFLGTNSNGATHRRWTCSSYYYSIRFSILDFVSYILISQKKPRRDFHLDP